MSLSFFFLLLFWPRLLVVVIFPRIRLVVSIGIIHTLRMTNFFAWTGLFGRTKPPKKCGNLYFPVPNTRSHTPKKNSKITMTAIQIYAQCVFLARDSCENQQHPLKMNIHTHTHALNRFRGIFWPLKSTVAESHFTTLVKWKRTGFDTKRAYKFGGYLSQTTKRDFQFIRPALTARDTPRLGISFVQIIMKSKPRNQTDTKNFNKIMVSFLGNIHMRIADGMCVCETLVISMRTELRQSKWRINLRKQ